MRIILDGMGGDNAPASVVEGAVLASKEIRHEILLVGQEELINTELKKYKYDTNKITVVNATEVISNDEAPVRAVRSKKDSSIVRGVNMVKSGEGDIFISAGSTGALMAGGFFFLGRIQGIDRPALASVYPILGSKASLLLDAGANAECKPNNLLEFGIMGNIYMEKVLGRENPRVGLVNLGAEAAKGNTLTKAAYELLEQSHLNFVGNVEAREVPKGACDVIVADGFTGNVILKLTEGLAWNILQTMKRKFTDGVKAKLGAALLDYDGFDEAGLNVMAGFDLQPTREQSEQGKPIYPMTRLETFCRRYQVRIGIVAVPADCAQEVCDSLIACGVEAIWNFAPVRLRVPEYVIVKNENLALSLTALRMELKRQDHEAPMILAE